MAAAGRSFGAARPIICVVTDRRRLARADRDTGDAEQRLLVQVTEAVSAGVDLVQIRERDLPAGRLHALAGRAVEIARGSGTRIVVNDRLDVALAAEAAGVHLREDSMPAARVRRIVSPEFLIGRSVHESAGVEADTGEDYLLFGAVYPTASKPGGRPAGVEALRRVAAGASIPVLAIGGLSVARAAEVASAGAAGVAGIGLFLPRDGSDTSLRATVEALRCAWQTL